MRQRIKAILAKFFPVTIPLSLKIFVNHQDTLPAGVSQTIIRDNVWATTETQLLQDELKNGDVMADVGANLGYFSLIGSKLVGSKGRIFSFEPDLNNFRLLTKNIKHNQLHNVTAVQSAIGQKSGLLKLFINENNKGDHRTFDSGDGRNFVTTKVTSLDLYFKNKKRLDFIKMDIQGFELFAFKGMSKTIKKHQPKILFEFWPFGLEKAGCNPKEVLTFLQQQNYELFILDEFKYKTEKLMPNQFDKFIKDLLPGEMCANLWCTPKA